MNMNIYIVILVLFFVYMVIWTLKFYFQAKRQQKVKRIQELRAKKKDAKHVSADDTRDYWYNLREVGNTEEDEDVTKFYNYFANVNEGVKGLLLEMYDCGIVRTDELAEVAYGQNHLENMDLSFLQDLDGEISGDNQDTVDIIQVEGMIDSGFFHVDQPDIVTAAKELKEDDPGITDIHGTLSQGMQNVIAAVDAEKKQEDEKNESILVKEEKSVEDARKAREMTSNAEIRNKVYEKWVGYVSQLYEIVSIHASEETKDKIHKALMNYGYNDVDVLLESPE